MANFSKITDIAKSKGLTIVELADEVGITDAAISILIKNNSTSTKTIEKIAQVLNVPVGTFFDEEQPKQITDDESVVLTPKILEMLNEKDRRIKELTDKLIDKQ